MRSRFHRHTQLLGSTLLTALVTVGAQTAPVLAQGTGGIEEVLVTAERRDQTVQTISASINAFDAEAIKDLRIVAVEDVGRVTPGLVLRSTGVSGDPVLTLRGLGMNNGETNQNSAVTAYLNNIALPSHAFLGFEIFDVERIEVLKGPQGTLYGRNTTGGAINFITKRPTRDFDARAQIDYGNLNLLEVEGAVGGALSDTVFARIAAKSKTRHGWQTLTLGDRHGDADERNGDIDRKAIRASVLFEPSDNFNFLVVADYGRNNSESVAYEHNGNLKTDGSRTMCDYPTTGIRDETSCGSYAIPRDAVGGNPLGGLEIFSDNDGDPRHAYGSYIFGNDNDAKTGGLMLEMNADFGGVTLTSVSGYRELKRIIGGDDGSPYILSDVWRKQKLRVFTQELRLASNNADTLDWIVGAYYTNDNNKDQAIFSHQDQFAYSAIFDSRYQQKTWAAAAFAQATWKVTDAFNVVGGARFTHEKRTFYYDGVVEGTGPYPVPYRGFEDSITADKVTGKLGIEYNATDDVMLYANVSHGFKGGGYPSTIAFSYDQLLSFPPETIWAYEAGFKSTLLDNTLRLNAAGYYYDWKDFQATTQVNRNGVPVTVLATAGDARIKGIEADIIWMPIPSLSLKTGLNYMHSNIVSGNYEGDRPPNTPKFMLNSVIRFEPEDGVGNTRPYIQVDMSYQSKAYSALRNNPAVHEEALYLINGRMGVVFENGVEFAVWGRNLANKLYRTQVLGPGSASLPARVMYADPRTYGVSLSWQY